MQNNDDGREVRREGMPNFKRGIALTGVIFGVLLVASFAVIGEPPTADDPIQDVASFYSEKGSKATTSALLAALSAVFFLFFVGSLGSVLQASEGATAGVSGVARAGGAVAAVGMLILAGLSFTLGDAAESVEPAAIQTLNALNDDFFFPLVGGVATFLLATGLVMVRSRTLPRWLGWTALAVAVAVFTPLGVSAFPAFVAWVVVASLVLGFRGEVSPRGTAGARTGAVR